MKALPDYIIIKCPKCSLKAQYDLPEKTILMKNNQCITEFYSYHDPGYQIYANIAVEERIQYSAIISFPKGRTKEIPLVDFINEDYLGFNSSYGGSKKKLGWTTCQQCGFNGSTVFSKELYYYQVNVKDFTIYARNLENFKGIINVFKNNIHLNGDPELDYPKKFWQNKDEIVRKMEKFLKDSAQ